MDLFLGITLPADLEATCEGYRRAFKAPKTIAHITVVPPFTWESRPEELQGLLEKSLGNACPFQVSGEGVGSFGTRVLFVNVDLTPELAALQQAITAALGQGGIAVDARPYNPHITLATRLDARQFAIYKAELSGFFPKYSFVCSHVSLFRFTQEKRWHKWCSLPLHQRS